MNTLAIRMEHLFHNAAVYTQTSKSWAHFKSYNANSAVYGSATTFHGAVIETQLERVDITLEELCALLNGCMTAWNMVCETAAQTLDNIEHWKAGVSEADMRLRSTVRCMMAKPVNCSPIPIVGERDGIIFYWDRNTSQWFCPDDISNFPVGGLSFSIAAGMAAPDDHIHLTGQQLCDMVGDYLSAFSGVGGYIGAVWVYVMCN